MLKTTRAGLTIALITAASWGLAPSIARAVDGPERCEGLDCICADGLDGPEGATGAKGPRGPSGATGPTGPTGATGAWSGERGAWSGKR